MNNLEEFLNGLTDEELCEVLRFGAHRLFDDEETKRSLGEDLIVDMVNAVIHAADDASDEQIHDAFVALDELSHGIAKAFDMFKEEAHEEDERDFIDFLLTELQDVVDEFFPEKKGDNDEQS